MAIAQLTETVVSGCNKNWIVGSASPTHHSVVETRAVIFSHPLPAAEGAGTTAKTPLDKTGDDVVASPGLEETKGGVAVGVAPTASAGDGVSKPGTGGAGKGVGVGVEVAALRVVVAAADDVVAKIDQVRLCLCFCF